MRRDLLSTLEADEQNGESLGVGVGGGGKRKSDLSLGLDGEGIGQKSGKKEEGEEKDYTGVLWEDQVSGTKRVLHMEVSI